MFEFNLDNGVTPDINIQINPFLHSSRKAIELIAALNQPKTKTTNCFEQMDDFVYSEEFENNVLSSIVNDYKEVYEMRLVYEQTKMDILASETENWTKIVLGGEFSAGKSSFLNSILCEENETDFLPTSQKPTSVIPTYIYCKPGNSIQKIIGENKFKNKTYLSKHVLLALGHDFERQHNISLSCFLDKLIIEQPTYKSYLKNIAFVDTPGYSKEDGENKNDENTAKESLKNGDVLFWLIDINNGTIKKNDLDFIKNNFDANKPKVIIFNKADMKPLSEINIIINDTARILNADNNRSIVDIIAYSSHDKTIMKSYKYIKNLDDLFKNLTVKNHSPKEKYIGKLYKSLNAHLDYYEEEIRSNNKSIKELNNIIIQTKENKDSNLLRIIKEEFEAYQTLLTAVKYDFDMMTDIAYNSLNRELKWSDKVGFFENGNLLLNQWDKDIENYKTLLKDAEEIPDTLSETIVEILDILHESETQEKEERIQNLSGLRNDYKELITDTKNKIKIHENLVYQLVNLMESAYLKHQNHQDNNYKLVGDINSKKNIYQCILNDDFDGFLDCLAVKTKISHHQNEQGYSILQFAVLHHRYKMVKLLLANKAKRLIKIKNDNGLTALELATKNNDTIMLQLLNS